LLYLSLFIGEKNGSELQCLYFRLLWSGERMNEMSETRRIILKPEPSCPKCGAIMRIRKPKEGGKDFTPFWGCNDYPTCNGTRNIDFETGKPETDLEEW
jgi:ssDNA-binding Zn-finger/Zn-ribbon topoisomerase 1